MDEKKATAYYDEMRRKGGGAAKLKQGLGYSAPSSPPPQASSYHSFPSFVKGDDHSESLSKHEKECRLAVVRDKLKKRPVENDDSDGHYRRSQEHISTRVHGHGHLPEGRHCSRRQDRDHKSRSERTCTRRKRESHSSSSRSRERTSRSHGSGSDSNYKKGNRLSCERSIDERKKRSRESLPRARRTSGSPRQSSRRSSRSSSPRAHGSNHRRHSYRDSRHPSHRSSSPYSEKQRKSEPRKDDTHNARKPNACDYSKLIAGYDNLTAAERVKEKMRLQLSETASKDTTRGMDIEWERFAFNKNAPLDDDAKLDYFGDGTGAKDDTGFLQNTGSTFLSTRSQAKREAHIQEAHESAIFGPSLGLSSAKTSSYEKEAHDFPIENPIIEEDGMGQLEAPSSTNNLLSDQVMTFQQGSWRERALKLKEQRAASAII